MRTQTSPDFDSPFKMRKNATREWSSKILENVMRSFQAYYQINLLMKLNSMLLLCNIRLLAYNESVAGPNANLLRYRSNLPMS